MPCGQIVLETIRTLKARNGCSSVAIKKSITASNPDRSFPQHLLRQALKKGVERELLIQAR